VLGVFVVIVLAACTASAGAGLPSANAAPGASASAAAVVSIAPSPPPSPAATPTAAPTFPMTLTDDDGTAVTIPAAPSRIVSLTPAATEILFGIGAGDRVVAKVEDVADYPPAAHDLPVVATYQGVDVEKIVGLDADLVIAGGNFGTPPDAVTKLRSLGIPVLVVYAPDVDGALRDIELIGSAAGSPGSAKDLTASMRADIDQVTAAIAGQPAPRVFYETGTGTGDVAVYGIADHSVYEAMLRLAGADPVTTGSGSDWEMPTEALVAADPQIILLGDAAYGITTDQVAARPGWKVLTAVKDGAIRPVDDIVVTRPGPRLVDGLRALVAAVHPGVALPSPVPAP